jgi:hypothetical protein
MKWPKRKTAWQRKQELAAPDRFYGDGGTIHRTRYLDVETYEGAVVAVWFRCQPIEFAQTEVDAIRAEQMLSMSAATITGIQVSEK